MRNIVILFLIAALFIIIAAQAAKAQTEPFILITWKALNYAPANFEGKILPMQNSPIIASVALLQNGKFIDTSKMQIRWTVDNQLIQSGTGLQTIVFQEPDLGNNSNNSTDITVEIPNYPSGSILNTISLTPVRPQAIIDAPYPQDQFSNQEIIIKALPYFFNVNNLAGLSISWIVNSQSPSILSDPSVLDIKFKQALNNNDAVYINLNINQKAIQFLGNAANSITLNYKQ
ncbi:hypothetical protein M1513_00395 [Patescibacteria group bacterium]|nr:hypothetical protein [Patescibacteria group bacterium]